MTTRQEAIGALDLVISYLPRKGCADEIATLRSYLDQFGEPVAYQWRLFSKFEDEWHLTLDWREGRAPAVFSDYVRVEERELFLGSSLQNPVGNAAAGTPAQTESGIGASYNRADDCWHFYITPGTYGVEQLGLTLKGYDQEKIDKIIGWLRTGYALSRQPVETPMSELQRLGQEFDAKVFQELNDALCEFLNNCGDEFEPTKWAESVKRDFNRLGKAYDAAFSAGIFPDPHYYEPNNQEPVAWQLVPVEPTPEMIFASLNALAEWRKTLDRDEAMMRSYIAHDRKFLASATPEEKVVIRYKAMLSAAPKKEG